MPETFEEDLKAARHRRAAQRYYCFSRDDDEPEPVALEEVAAPSYPPRPKLSYPTAGLAPKRGRPAKPKTQSPMPVALEGSPALRIFVDGSILRAQLWSTSKEDEKQAWQEAVMYRQAFAQHLSQLGLEESWEQDGCLGLLAARWKISPCLSPWTKRFHGATPYSRLIQLRACAEQLGQSPNSVVFAECLGVKNARHLYSFWGSWQEFVKAAGLEPKRYRRRKESK